MSLIVDVQEVKSSFVKKWTSTYVPAIIEYMRNSGKFLTLLSKMDESGEGWTYHACIHCRFCLYLTGYIY